MTLSRRKLLSSSAALAVSASGHSDAAPPTKSMDLGAFSVSLNVKDLEVSKQFYEKLGFRALAGMPGKYQVMKNGDRLIGLFQGMFEKNILTFNPGWDTNGKPVGTFTDVRELQRQLKAQGVKFSVEADETTKGPASFVVTDPDGNPILVDQHV
jgi:lactoylglutathione lyase